MDFSAEESDQVVWSGGGDTVESSKGLGIVVAVNTSQSDWWRLHVRSLGWVGSLAEMAT